MTFSVNPSPEIRRIQKEDPMCQYIFSGIRIRKNKIIERSLKLLMVLYRKPTKRVPTSRIVIPVTKFADIFKQYHTDTTGGHYGHDKTMNRINQYFWHPLLGRMIQDKIRSFELCQRNKGPVSREENVFNPEIANYPMEKIQIDILGPIPETRRRNKYIITAIDTCTRYLFAQALKRIRAEETIGFLKNVISEKGTPRIIRW